MKLTAYFQRLAEYNTWINERIYGVYATIPDGAFFRSIHGMLNHLLLADRL